MTGDGKKEVVVVPSALLIFKKQLIFDKLTINFTYATIEVSKVFA